MIGFVVNQRIVAIIFIISFLKCLPLISGTIISPTNFTTETLTPTASTISITRITTPITNVVTSITTTAATAATAVTAATAPGDIAVSVQRPCSCDGPNMDCSHRGKVTLSGHEICPRSRILNFRNNSLTTFPDTLRTFTELDLSENELKTLPASTLLNRAINTLKLSRNRITGSSDHIKTLSSLEFLDVNINGLTNLKFVPKPCNLRVLEASVNNISSLEGIQKCSKLVSLYIARNNISMLASKVFSKMSELIELGVYGNPLVNIFPDTFMGLKSLLYLYMSDTSLTKIPDGIFLPLPSLQRLYLSSNPRLIVTTNTFNGLSKLTHLHIRNANVREIPKYMFSELRRLEVLNLAENRLQSLPMTAFEELSLLKDLDLSENFLSKLTPGVFSGLKNLQTLHLENNRLKEIQDNVLTDLTEVEVIEMSSNLFTNLPMLRTCCDKVNSMSLRNNSITSLSHTRLRSLLRRQMVLDLRSNHVTPEDLIWAWEIPTILPFVDRNKCNCGGFQMGNGTIELCVDVTCGTNADFVDWVQASMAAAVE